MNANERKSVAKDHMIFICLQITQIFADYFLINLLNPNISGSTCCHR